VALSMDETNLIPLGWPGSNLCHRAITGASAGTATSGVQPSPRLVMLCSADTGSGQASGDIAPQLLPTLVRGLNPDGRPG
jgi:hypothetical protein